MPYKLNPHTGQLDYYETGGTSAVTILADFSTDANNSGTAETDLYSYSLPANTLNANNQKIRAEFHGIAATNANIKDIKIYFGGTMIGSANFGGLVETHYWSLSFICIRKSNTELLFKVIVKVYNSTTQLYTFQDELPISLSSLNLTTTAYIIKITGQSDTASSDVTAKFGTIKFESAA